MGRVCSNRTTSSARIQRCTNLCSSSLRCCKFKERHRDFKIGNTSNIGTGKLSSLTSIVNKFYIQNPSQYPTITTACIPNTVVTGLRCWVTGWGRNDFSSTGQFQATQKEVDVPIVDQATCQTQLRATRLGANFALDFPSFVCAGGESGKDACTG